MDHYLEIKLMPDAEVQESFLLNKIYTKLHKALYEINSNAIGVSFPNYKIKLGNKIRLHGSDNSLEKLQALNWLGSLVGYCNVSIVNKIPEKVQHRNISRKQSNMTQAKLNRLIKRESIKPEQVHHYKTKMLEQGLDNPYVELESNSNGHKHRRYIELGELKTKAVIGEFDHFGLSKQATVPWF